MSKKNVWLVPGGCKGWILTDKCPLPAEKHRLVSGTREAVSQWMKNKTDETGVQFHVTNL